MPNSLKNAEGVQFFAIARLRETGKKKSEMGLVSLSKNLCDHCGVFFHQLPFCHERRRFILFLIRERRKQTILFFSRAAVTVTERFFSSTAKASIHK